MTDFVLEFSIFKRSVRYLRDGSGNKDPGLGLKGCLRDVLQSAVMHLEII